MLCSGCSHTCCPSMAPVAPCGKGGAAKPTQGPRASPRSKVLLPLRIQPEGSAHRQFEEPPRATPIKPRGVGSLHTDSADPSALTLPSRGQGCWRLRWAPFLPEDPTRGGAGGVARAGAAGSAPTPLPPGAEAPVVPPRPALIAPQGARSLPGGTARARVPPGAGAPALLRFFPKVLCGCRSARVDRPRPGAAAYAAERPCAAPVCGGRH